MRQMAFAFGPAQVLIAAGAWLLPWLVVMLVACSLAYAADLGLVRTWSEAPAAAAPRPAGQRWVRIDAIGEDGSRYAVQCLAKPGVFASDEIVLEVSELDGIAAASCDQLETRGRD
jgi:hypothetical protein